MSIKTFVFFDTETTGLPKYEDNKTRITELCLIAVKSDHLLNGVPPRIQNKINLCLNPDKPIHPKASDITGLTNEELELQPKFDLRTYNLMCDFLNLHEKPVCLVAHYGNGFDYPILRAEIHKAGGTLSESDQILCVDSWKAFLELSKKKEPLTNNKKKDLQDDKPGSSPRKRPANDETAQFDAKRRKLQECPNFKLVVTYEMLTGKEPINAHQAESDVNMLIECATVLGPHFVDWCNANAKPLNNIPMMKPGV